MASSIFSSLLSDALISNCTSLTSYLRLWSFTVLLSRLNTWPLPASVFICGAILRHPGIPLVVKKCPLTSSSCLSVSLSLTWSGRLGSSRSERCGGNERGFTRRAGVQKEENGWYLSNTTLALSTADQFLEIFLVRISGRLVRFLMFLPSSSSEHKTSSNNLVNLLKVVL